MESIRSNLDRPLFSILLLCFCFLSRSIEAGTVILVTVRGSSTELVEGDGSDLDKTWTPASTFKIVIAWAGLEAGVVTPETEHWCTDAHVPNAPRSLNLTQAMFYSSNDYFLWLAERIGWERLDQLARSSGFINGEFPVNWLKQKSSVIKGGELRVSVRQQHRFIQKVMNGELASSNEIQRQLLRSMEWPSKNPKIQLYGKTGSWGGVFWFNGFGKSPEGLKAVTVIVRGKEASREKAIAAFYKRWGLPPPKIQ